MSERIWLAVDSLARLTLSPHKVGRAPSCPGKGLANDEKANRLLSLPVACVYETVHSSPSLIIRSCLLLGVAESGSGHLELALALS